MNDVRTRTIRNLLLMLKLLHFSALSAHQLSNLNSELPIISKYIFCVGSHINLRKNIAPMQIGPKLWTHVNRFLTLQDGLGSEA